MHQKGASQEAEERTSPKALVIFEAIRREGAQELERPPLSLAWSGLAAGLSMGFSMIAEAVIASHLPDAPWTPLISKFGYSAGFLIVILGRQQLFTEDTLTPVLQLLDETTADVWKKISRLWLIVFVSNIAGALIFSFVLSHVFIFEPVVYSQFNAFAQSTVKNNFGITFFRGIFAGWLIALIIWILPFAEQARFWVIIVITYLIGIGGLSHIIVGSIEGFYGLFAGQIAFIPFILKFFIPALLGNIVGGVALVAAINYAQINYERV